MLTLTPGCACDVCAEEYGPNRLPHSIPCGHVLCANCCQTIVEKTNPRLSPVCPFCRESFSGDSMRVIRMDFATSGWTTPRRVPANESFNDINSAILQRKTAHLFNSPDGTRTRIEVRRLEDKVSRIAAKKCSVEEVSALYKELEEWLLAEKEEQTTSLFLSAALLRAILMNHVAHSEASKAAKTTDANLRHKIDGLDAELRRLRTQYNTLYKEYNQLKALSSTLPSGASAPELPPAPAPVSQSASAYQYPSAHSTSPTPYSTSQTHFPSSSASASASAAASASSPLSRFNSMHGRSASMSSRPTTPASISLSHSQQPVSPTRAQTPAPPRSHTPGPSPSRSYTPAGPPRSHTPGLSSASAAAAAHAAVRSHTPSLRAQPSAAPPVPSMPARYASTPTPAHPSLSGHHAAHAHAGPPLSASTGMGLGYGFRSQTPAPAQVVPPKPRRLSLSGTGGSPPRMARTTSEEKAEAHQRWLPPGLSLGGEEKGHARTGSRAGFRI